MMYVPDLFSLSSSSPSTSSTTMTCAAIPAVRKFSIGRSLLSIALFLTFIVGSASAQDRPAVQLSEPLFYFGFFGGVALNAHAVNMNPQWFAGRAFPAEQLFTEGKGVGATGGLLLEYPFSRAFSVGGRLSVQGRGGEMNANYQDRGSVVSTAGGTRTTTVQGTVSSSLTYLVLTPHLRIIPKSIPLYFFAGPSLLAPIGAKYDYREKIVPSGEDVVFRSTKGDSRTVVERGNIPQTPFKLGMALGMGLEFPLAERLKLIVDGQYAPMLGNLTNAITASDDPNADVWRADPVTLTLGIKFGMGERRLQALPLPPPKPDTPQVKRTLPDTVDRIPAGAVTDQGLKDTIVARSQKVQQTEVHALLPYLFFERDSAIVPARYTKLGFREIRDFREEKIARGSTLNVYYQLLNIIGGRLRTNRRSTITIEGHIGMFEIADSGLSLRRAEAVRDYLRDVWRIREDRMQVVAGGLPSNPSLSEVDTVEGDLENQRVEFHSSDSLILAPVRLPDTLLLQPAGVIRLLPPPPDQPDSIATLESWQVNVKIGDSVIPKVVTGYGAPPEQIEFALEERPDLTRHGAVEITSELVILDSLFEKRRALPAKSVWFVEEGGYQVERNIENGKYVDRYNLLLYSFDSAGIFDFSQQAASIMRERITPLSTVKIIGHTDRIGLPPYNKKLSMRRAEVAAGLLALPNAEVVGLGEKELLYDNEFPEGRYLSRTVTVIIETPIPTAVDSVRKPLSSGTTTSPEVSNGTAEVKNADAKVPMPVSETKQGSTEIKVETPATETIEPKKREKGKVPTSVTLPVPEEKP